MVVKPMLWSRTTTAFTVTARRCAKLHLSRSSRHATGIAMTLRDSGWSLPAARAKQTLPDRPSLTGPRAATGLTGVIGEYRTLAHIGRHSYYAARTHYFLMHSR
jgi:hypothetical protein